MELFNYNNRSGLTTVCISDKHCARTHKYNRTDQRFGKGRNSIINMWIL